MQTPTALWLLEQSVKKLANRAHTTESSSNIERNNKIKKCLRNACPYKYIDITAFF